MSADQNFGDPSLNLPSAKYLLSPNISSYAVIIFIYVCMLVKEVGNPYEFYR